jgi:hypothetical protein
MRAYPSEQAFAENIHTARGQAVHHLVDVPGYELKHGIKVSLLYRPLERAGVD